MINVTPSDRLAFTLLLSIIIHLLVILGVSFDAFSPPTNIPINNIDITLVKQQDEIKPETADFLAQADNEGGGEKDTPTPDPTPDLPVPLTKEEPVLQPVTSKARPSEPKTAATEPPVPVEPVPEKIVPPQQVPEPAPPKLVKPEPKPEPKQPVKKITQQQAERKVEQVEKPASETKPVTKISAQALITQAHNDIDELQRQLDKHNKTLSERPKKRRISAATEEFAAAAYMKAWEMKVERLGNMNYPQEAREKDLGGSLMLSVDINPDGSVPEGGIVVSRSSGIAILDEAAIKIVRLGSPYAAIPKNVLKDNDMLTIIRTWKFETGRGLSPR